MGCEEIEPDIQDGETLIKTIRSSGLDPRVRISSTIVPENCAAGFNHGKCLTVGTWSISSKDFSPWKTIKIEQFGCEGENKNKACKKCPLYYRRYLSVWGRFMLWLRDLCQE